MWQLTHDIISATIKSYFNVRDSNYIEGNIKYHVPNINSELSKRTIVYQGPKIWNKLKNDMENKKSVPSFKKDLENELILKDI